MSMVEVWQEPSRFWRWRYLEPPGDAGDALELVSNDIYDEREAAVEAAMTAYPGVPVRERETPPGAAERSGRAGWARGVRSRGRLLALLGLAAAAFALRHRRRRDRR